MSYQWQLVKVMLLPDHQLKFLDPWKPTLL